MDAAAADAADADAAAPPSLLTRMEVDVSSCVLILLTAFVLFIGAYYAGHVFKRLSLPAITAYFLVGLLLGPHSFNMVNRDSLEWLKLMDGTCLCMIGLCAGTEVSFQELAPHLSIVWVYTLAITAGTWLLVTPVVHFFVAPNVPFLVDMAKQANGPSRVWAITSLIGTPTSTVVEQKESSSLLFALLQGRRRRRRRARTPRLVRVLCLEELALVKVGGVVPAKIPVHASQRNTHE